jgi:ribosomal-protein-alanine N-acetyltransferase
MHAITVSPFLTRDRQAVDDLIFRSHQLHTHLDWHDVHDWLDTRKPASLQLAWQDRRLVGVVGMSEALHDMAWCRLIAIHNFAPAQDVLNAMWGTVVERLRQSGVEGVSVLVSRPWLQPMLATLGFTFDEDIITLQRSGQRLPAARGEKTLITNLREMFPNDLDAVLQVDHAAFKPTWQLGRDELYQARRISAASTVALQNELIVGYQISTVYRDGAHLARLAVAPDVQGHGVGAALLGDALRRFFRRNIHTMTVNTQASNHRSQRLYHQFGFERNGNDLPVWSMRL